MMLRLIKKSNYYCFCLDDKILKTPLNNEIQISVKKIAIRLGKYLELCINSKNKEKKFFLEILYFCYDLNHANKDVFLKEMTDNLNTDLLCYRANKKYELDEIQKKMWDPLLFFVKQKYKLSFKIVNSVMPVEQDSKNIVKLKNILKSLDNQKFSAYYFINNFTNSNIIALNFLANNIKSNYVWDCLSLEDNYSLKKWGNDKEAQNKLLEKKKYFDEIVNFNLLLNNLEMKNDRK